MDMHEVVNYLVNATDEDFAEVFARYSILSLRAWKDPDTAQTSEDLDLTADDMKINVKELIASIQTALDEIIYSDEICSSAWWKGANA